MILVLRRWSRKHKRSAHQDSTPAPENAPVDDAYRQRLDQALENME